MGKVVNLKQFGIVKEINEKSKEALEIISKYGTSKNRKMSDADISSLNILRDSIVSLSEELEKTNKGGGNSWLKEQ